MRAALIGAAAAFAAALALSTVVHEVTLTVERVVTLLP